MARKSNKRIQKKAQTKANTSKLQKAGYTPKQQKRLTPEVKRKEIKRLAKNEQNRLRTQNNRQQLLKDGVPLSIITAERLDRKSYNNLSKKQIAEYKRKGHKLDALKQAGFSYKEVKSDLTLSVQKLKDKYLLDTIQGVKPVFDSRKVYTCNSYLYIGYADIDGFVLEDLTGVTDNHLKYLINYMIDEAKKAPDDSAGFRGVFKVEQSEDLEVINHIAWTYYQHGYDLNPNHIKFDNHSYSKITISNKFTQRDFWEMIFTCIGQMKNSDVSFFIQDMDYYCKENNLPFMRNLRK